MKQLWFKNSVQKVFSPTSLKLTTSVESLHCLVMRNIRWYPSDSSCVPNTKKNPNTIGQGRLQSWELCQSDSERLTRSERGRGRKWNDIKTLPCISLKTVPWLQACLNSWELCGVPDIPYRDLKTLTDFSQSFKIQNKFLFHPHTIWDAWFSCT